MNKYKDKGMPVLCSTELVKILYDHLVLYTVRNVANPEFFLQIRINLL